MTDGVNLGVELSTPSRNWRRGGIRITLKSIEGLHRFFNDFRIDTRFSHQNRNFLITRPSSLPPNKVSARFLGHAFGDFAEPWVAYPGHGMDRSREREQSRCRNDAKMPLAA
jgi:hypothetical protein